jgi:hypothetical protein
MSEIEKQVTDRLKANADLEGAQDLIDAHLDGVGGGGFWLAFGRFLQAFGRAIA